MEKWTRLASCANQWRKAADSRLQKGAWILERDLNIHATVIHTPVMFGHAQHCGMREVAANPALVVEPDGVYDEGVACPLGN